jgi:hypothetical protein
MRISFIRVLVAGLALSACSTDSVMRPDVDVGMQTAALVPMAPVEPQQSYPVTPLTRDEILPEQSMQVQPAPEDRLVQSPIAAGFTRLTHPFGFGNNNPAGMPAEEASCRKDLRRLGVTFRELPPINDGGVCNIPYPLEVTGMPGGARLTPAATLNCAMTLRFASWVKKELQPAARLRYFSSVGTITQASSYSCRKMVGNDSGKMSEHAKGNALDVAKIELNNGHDILVRKKGLFSFRERGLLNTIRADGCDYFSTVLGPGYNKAHADHFHFDIMARKNGHVACN